MELNSRKIINEKINVNPEIIIQTACLLCKKDYQNFQKLFLNDREEIYQYIYNNIYHLIDITQYVNSLDLENNTSYEELITSSMFINFKNGNIPTVIYIGYQDQLELLKVIGDKLQIE